jgi:hypothetical protein
MGRSWVASFTGIKGEGAGNLGSDGLPANLFFQ